MAEIRLRLNSVAMLATSSSSYRNSKFHSIFHVHPIKMVERSRYSGADEPVVLLLIALLVKLGISPVKFPEVVTQKKK